MENPPILNEASKPCLNCDAPLNGSYCGNCGQEAKDLRRPFFKLSREAVQSLFELDGRAIKTLFYLATKPGYLSREYFSGRQTRYTAPLRLFLVISVSFFLLISIYTSILSIEEALNTSDEEAGEEIATATGDEASFIIGDDLDTNDEEANGIAEVLAVVDQINLPFFDEQMNSNLHRVMRAQAETTLNTLVENPTEFARGYLEYITLFMLLMMPLLALIQKLIYIRTGHYYVEHLVLTLHNLAFVIFILFAGSLIGMVEEGQIPIISYLFGFLGTAIYIWMWVYLFLSLKNYFQQGYGITLLKFTITTILYAVILSFGVLVLSGILFFSF